jgi:hypothetical protein
LASKNWVAKSPGSAHAVVADEPAPASPWQSREAVAKTRSAQGTRVKTIKHAVADSWAAAPRRFDNCAAAGSIRGGRWRQSPIGSVAAQSKFQAQPSGLPGGLQQPAGAVSCRGNQGIP